MTTPDRRALVELIRSPLFQQFLAAGFWDASHVDLVWRHNGRDIREEADWLKDVWYALWRAAEPHAWHGYSPRRLHEAGITVSRDFYVRDAVTNESRMMTDTEWEDEMTGTSWQGSSQDSKGAKASAAAALTASVSTAQVPVEQQEIGLYRELLSIIQRDQSDSACVTAMEDALDRFTARLIAEP